MDPGTAAILTLSTITGISGYGAMKLNAKRGASIDEEVKKAIGDAQALIKSAQDAKLIAEQERNKKEEEVKKLSAEIAKMQKAQQQLVDEKVVLSKNLESATELEKTYRELTPEVFKQAINDFKAKPEIEKLGHPELFEPLLSRFSVTRGTARALYAKFESVVVGMIPKADFDVLLLDALKNGSSSLEQRKKKEAEAAQAAKDKAAAEAKAIKDKADAAAKVKAAEAQAVRDVAAAEAAALRKAAIEKAAADAAARKAAQEKGALTLRTPTGGMRKKKLRTRRGGKQNDRRTRRSKNRSNRSHPNAG
jgi:colicin import membrane protein